MGCIALVVVSRAEHRELSKHIFWHNDGCHFNTHPGAPPGLVFEGEHSVWRKGCLILSVLDLFHPGDVLVPASFVVQRMINEKLKGNATPQLRYNPETGTRVLQVFPDNLLSQMWLQFARAIAGNLQYRACKECNKWFEISETRRTAPPR